MDPDPEGPKAYGSDGSGSATLLFWIRIHTQWNRPKLVFYSAFSHNISKMLSIDSFLILMLSFQKRKVRIWKTRKLLILCMIAKPEPGSTLSGKNEGFGHRFRTGTWKDTSTKPRRNSRKSEATKTGNTIQRNLRKINRQRHIIWRTDPIPLMRISSALRYGIQKESFSQVWHLNMIKAK